MNDRVFLDTNIIFYSYSNNEKEKQVIARSLISNNQSVISTQVLQELINITTKKLGYTYTIAIATLDECISNNLLHYNSEVTLRKACRIADQEKFSFYDSLIIASALESECNILYSEDMQDGRIINGKIKIINPFSK